MVTGVRLGDRLSPLLFNIALEDILQKARDKDFESKIGWEINLLAFADDVTILAETKEYLEESTSFILEIESMGLQVS